MDYIDYVYSIIKREMEENLKSKIITKENAICLIGVRGFSSLIDNDILRYCGIIEGHNTYYLSR